MSVLGTQDVSLKRAYMRAADRRAQILGCAKEVFAERGYHETTIADVCERAGIGRGTLYQHFDNKRDVFMAVVDEIATKVASVAHTRPRVAQMEGVEDAPPKLIAAYCARRMRELLDAVFVDEASVRLVLREARGLDGGIDQMLRRFDRALLSAFVADLEAARDWGVIHCENPELTAMFIIGGVEKLVLMALESDEVDLDEIVRVSISVQLFGLLGNYNAAGNHSAAGKRREE